MRRVLILQAGSADPALRARYGDYPDWFARHLAPRVELRVVRPYEQVLPSSAGFDGLVMTGSPKSVLVPEPWMEESAAFLLEAARTRPVLGVCFGHQLLARALGGRVELNPPCPPPCPAGSAPPAPPERAPGADVRSRRPARDASARPRGERRRTLPSRAPGRARSSGSPS